MTVLYTADPHFGHKNVIRFSKRPYEDAEAMDNALVDNWNSVVGPDDVVHVLGDFTFKGKSRADEYLARLNGEIHLVVGNHDPESTRSRDRWASVRWYSEIHDGEDMVCLFHYPMREWNGCYRGSYHLYGHVHGGAPAQGRSLDVGVDCWDYRPVTLAQVKARLVELGTHDTLIPHHGRIADPNWSEA